MSRHVCSDGKPSKWAVRQWLAERRADRTQAPPAPDDLRRRLGWRLCRSATNHPDHLACRAPGPGHLSPTDQEAA
jgi:hypothetical protein